MLTENIYTTNSWVFQDFLFLIGKLVHSDLVRQIEYLKVENKILRSKLGKRVSTTGSEKRRLKLKGTRKNKFIPVRDWFVAELGLFTGFRVEEMVELKVKDVLVGEGHASIIVRHGKGDKKRAVWINHVFKHECGEFLNLREKLGLNNAPEEFLITSQKGKLLTKRALQKRFKLCVKNAKLPVHYSIHCLRHTYGTYLLRVSGNLKLVKEQLGHSSIKTTEVYISLIENDTKEALRKLYKKSGENQRR